MWEHVVTLTHPVQVRLRGFDAGGQTRALGGAAVFAGIDAAFDGDGLAHGRNLSWPVKSPRSPARAARALSAIRPGSRRVSR
mgnify:CR=1 FL=1